MRMTVVAASAAALCAGVGAAVAVGAGGEPRTTTVVCVSKQDGTLHARTRGRCVSSQRPLTIEGRLVGSIPASRLTGSIPASRLIGTLPSNLRFTGTIPSSQVVGTLPAERLTGTIPLDIRNQLRGPAGPEGPPGAPGAEGRIGPTGPPGLPRAVATFSDGASRSSTAADSPVALGSVDFAKPDDGKPHLVLVTGGFDAVCGPCEIGVGYRARFEPASGGTPLDVLSRQVGYLLSARDTRSAVVSEVVQVGSSGTVKLAMSLSAASSNGTPAPSVSSSAVRLSVTDLGPAPER